MASVPHGASASAILWTAAESEPEGFLAAQRGLVINDEWQIPSGADPQTMPGISLKVPSRRHSPELQYPSESFSNAARI